MVKKIIVILLVILLSFKLLAQDWSDTQIGPPINDLFTVTPAWDEEQIIFIQTNDMHGQINSVPSRYENDRILGGLDFLKGYLDIIRENNEDVFLLDAGDSFQGSLTSNLYEGKPLVEMMNHLNYTAVLAGNHGFDYGPEGEEASRSQNSDPQGALKARIKESNFPYLAANVYLIDSLFYQDGAKVDFKKIRKLQDSYSFNRKAFEKKIDWSKAKRPPHFTPYVLKETKMNYLFGRESKLAFIGLESIDTRKTTQKKNIGQLYFRDEVQTYNEIHRELSENQDINPDIFILLAHFGAKSKDRNAPQYGDVVKFVRSLKKGTLHAVISGHTHSKIEQITKSVPIVQSWSYGKYFGEIRLIVNVFTNKLVHEKTRLQAGIPIYNFACRSNDQGRCADDFDSHPTFRGKTVAPDLKINQIRQDYNKKVQHIAYRILAFNESKLLPSRTGESNLGNLVSDAIKEYFQADIGLVNSGGVRTPIDVGPIHYRELFKAIPFDNYAVLVENFTVANLVAVLEKHADSCGHWGGVQISGLKVKYHRDCSEMDLRGGAIASKVLKIKTDDGRLIYENGKIMTNRKFSLATIDFLIESGRYQGLLNLTVSKKGPLFREVVDQYLSKDGPQHRINRQLEDRLVMEEEIKVCSNI